jgi:ATP-binding cassette, subfamily C, bacteriocin exporter
VFKYYNIVKQKDIKDCGVCCLLSIIRYYKSDFSLEVLRDYTKTDKNGTNAYSLVEVAKKIGFEACGLKGNMDNLNDKKIILPAIAHVILNKSYNHYVIIYEINFKKKYLIIGDPSQGIIKYSFEDFNQIWSGVIIVLYPVKKLLVFNKKNIKDYIYILIKRYKKNIILILFLSLFITLLSIINSFYFKIIIDDILLTKSITSLYILSFFFLIIITLKVVTDLFRKKVLLFFNKELDASIFFNIYHHIINLPYQYYKNRNTGEIVNRLMDINYIRDVINKLFLTVFIDSFLLVFSVIALFLISSQLFFISLIIVLLYFIVIVIFSKPFNRYINKIKDEEACFTNYLIESINNYEMIKGININDNIISKGYLKYIHYIDNVYAFNNSYNVQSFFKDIINYVGQIAIILMGSILVINNKITMGSLIAFITLLVYFLEPIKNMIDLQMLIRYSKTIVDRIIDLYNIPIQTKNNDIIYKITGDIKINNLYFSYNNRDNILKDINLEIKSGEKVLVVGNSGSGKSTLLKLLLKYYDSNNNSIFINNIDINNYDINIIRKNISYVSQNEKLFTDSIYNNILLDRNISNDIFIKITKILKINNIYKNNPLCYDMLIEEDGFNISGGEKQRIIMARTLLENKAIYLFDESMNQVDIELEKEIILDIFNMLKNKTIIMSSHRLNNKNLFDKIIYLKNGQINKIVSKRNLIYE